MSYKEILFFIVVFVSNVIQCITGFAGTVLAMPFSLMLVGFGVAKPCLNLLGIVVSLGVVGTNYKSINIKELLKIVGVMLIGMVAGFFLNNHLSLNEHILYKILGVVVLVFMLIGCYTTFIKNGKNKEKHKEKSKKRRESVNFMTIMSYLILVVAGLVHGMFVCGGPLLIIYASEHLKNRNEFRTTLSAVWVILNSVMLLSDIKAGYFDKNLIIISLISIGILFFALLVGNFVARRINNKWFMIITYVLMGVSGLSLIVK